MLTSETQCSVILSTGRLPSCSENGCCVRRLHVCIPGSREGRGNLASPNRLPVCFKEGNELPGNCGIDFPSHFTGYNGVSWQPLVTEIRNTPRSGRRGERTWKGSFNLLNSGGNRPFHMKGISLEANLTSGSMKTRFCQMKGATKGETQEKVAV